MGLFKAVQRGKDPAMFVVLFEDSAAMLGLIVAAAGIFLSQITANPIYDGLASIIIGLILAATAAWLAYETKSLLIGESANPEVIRGIRKIAESHGSIQHVNEILTLHMGPDFILRGQSYSKNATCQHQFDGIALNNEFKRSLRNFKAQEILRIVVTNVRDHSTNMRFVIRHEPILNIPAEDIT